MMHGPAHIKCHKYVEFCKHFQDSETRKFLELTEQFEGTHNVHHRIGESGKRAIQLPFTFTKNFGVYHVIDFDLHRPTYGTLDFRRVQHFIKTVVEYSQDISTCGSDKDNIICSTEQAKRGCDKPGSCLLHYTEFSNEFIRAQY